MAARKKKGEALVVIEDQVVNTETSYFVARSEQDDTLAMFAWDDYAIEDDNGWDDDEDMPSGYVTYTGDLTAPTMLKFLQFFKNPESVTISYNDNDDYDRDQPEGWYFIVSNG